MEDRVNKLLAEVEKAKAELARVAELQEVFAKQMELLFELQEESPDPRLVQVMGCATQLHSALIAQPERPEADSYKMAISGNLELFSSSKLLPASESTQIYLPEAAANISWSSGIRSQNLQIESYIRENLEQLNGPKAVLLAIHELDRGEGVGTKVINEFFVKCGFETKANTTSTITNHVKKGAAQFVDGDEKGQHKLAQLTPAGIKKVEEMLQQREMVHALRQ